MKLFIKNVPEAMFPWKVYYLKDGIGYQISGGHTYLDAKQSRLRHINSTAIALEAMHTSLKVGLYDLYWVTWKF